MRLKDKNLFKKSVVIGILIFVLILGIQWVFINRYIKLEQANQLKLYKNSIGALKSFTDIEDDILRDSFLGDVNESNVRLGEEFLSKFGYKDKMNILDNKLFISDSKSFYITTGLSMIISITLASLVILYLRKGARDTILSISDDLSKITYGSVYEKRDESGIDELSILNNRINNLHANVTKSINDINSDRRIMKELINDLSHQIKTPIASLKLSNSFLEEEDLTEEEKQEFIKTSHEDIERLEWFAEGLVQVARLETGIVNLDMKPGKLGETLIDAINSVFTKAINKEIEVKFNEFPDVMIEHDYRWTKEAIINIVDNAIKYCDFGGNIYIALEDSRESTRIIVRDTGRGIPQDEIYNIFKRFYRGREADVQKKEGSGLGLYLSRRIIEGQNGTIGVVSEVGVGSTFTIILFKKLDI